MVPNKKSKIPYTDLKPKIRQINTKKWRQLWEKNPHNKLFQVQPILKERKMDPNNTRREETTLAHLRIRHTRLTHSFILKDEPPPKSPCRNQYTIKHILIECTKLTNIWQRFYNVDNMNKLFRIISRYWTFSKESISYQRCRLIYFWFKVIWRYMMIFLFFFLFCTFSPSQLVINL